MDVDFSLLVGRETKVADLELQDFDKLFCVVQDGFNDDYALADELNHFHTQFRPVPGEARFAD